MKIRAVFLGTPAAAVPSLAALTAVTEVAAVITMPDRARGRSGRKVPPPVKVAAAEWGIVVVQPDGTDDLDGALRAIRPDVAVIVAYGKILPAGTLALVPRGFVNVHFSLLPRWRGAAPVERAILAGDPMVGVSLMLLDEGMDTGPVIGAVETPLGDDETGGELTARLAALGASLLEGVLPSYLAGAAQPAPQLGSGATIASRLSSQEARIDPSLGEAAVRRAIRAFHPRPGGWLSVEGKRMTLVRAAAVEGNVLPAGRIEAIGGSLYLGTGDGSVELLMVRSEGDATMTGREWTNSRRGAPATADPGTA